MNDKNNKNGSVLSYLELISDYQSVFKDKNLLMYKLSHIYQEPCP